MNWICIQLGAREHYAIPRALKASGRLETLFTEFWAGPLWRRLAIGPLRPFATRFHPDLEDACVTDWMWRTLWRDFGEKLKIGNRKSEIGNDYRRFIRDGKWFSETVLDHLARLNADLRGTVVFSYDTTALELFQWARERGAFCVLGQMDPNRVEVKLVQAEEKLWPGWAKTLEIGNGSLEEYFQRREAEWALADRVVVNSRWSFDALAAQGVPPEKLVEIPLCFEKKTETLKAEKRKAAEPFRVLFLGQVILRKGVQYLVETAKLLRDEPVHFDVVGPSGISGDAMKSAPANVTFHGRADRDEAGGWYRRADVFVLPTISDGFALTQIEAMAHGLPVIATPNCGEVVTDGADGFIVPARDAGALAKAIRRYLAEPELLRGHGAAAFNKSKQFTLERLGARLAELETGLRAENKS